MHSPVPISKDKRQDGAGESGGYLNVKLDDAAIKTFFSDKSLAKAKCPDL
jgi:hypothetical protein